MKNLKVLFLPVILFISACSTTYTAETDHNKEYGKQFCSIAHGSDLSKANRTQGDHGHVEGIYQAYFG